MSIRKYPRTRHVAGSRFQPGDEDLASVPFRELVGRHVVVEEKMDGANCAFSFGPDADLRLQSRGHYLVGGPRERHFDLFKRWANYHAGRFVDVVGGRYVVYGEWLHAKHTVYYDALPHYFMEFDVLDLEKDAFLDTPRRSELLAPLPIAPVRVIFSGLLETEEQLRAMMGRSPFITREAPQHLRETAGRLSLDPDQVLAQSDVTGLMEGLYLKVEEDGVVVERLKFVRPDFVTQLQQADSHWQARPIVPDALAEDVDLFEGEPS